MKIGYARVSTQDQDLRVQLKQLKTAGCVDIYREKVSGAYTLRPQLGKMLQRLQAGDVVTITKLDRLGRSTVDLLDLVRKIDAAGAGFVSLSEPWANTTTPAGRLIVTVFSGVAQFERERILERCSEGRDAARARGVWFGGKAKLSPDGMRKVRDLMAAGERPDDVARMFNISRSTAFRLRQDPDYLKHLGGE